MRCWEILGDKINQKEVTRMLKTTTSKKRRPKGSQNEGVGSCRGRGGVGSGGVGSTHACAEGHRWPLTRTDVSRRAEAHLRPLVGQTDTVGRTIGAVRRQDADLEPSSKMFWGRRAA